MVGACRRSCGAASLRGHGRVWTSHREGGCERLRLDSDELGPVVVGHDARASPFLAVDIGASACKEAIVSMLEDRDPGRRFWVLEPLQVTC